METFDFGSINSIYSMVAILAYISYSLIKDISKNVSKRKKSNIDDVLKKIEDLENRENAKHKEIQKELASQKMLISISLTPANCSNSRFLQLEKEFERAKEKGVNGVAAQAFLEFSERREKMQQNLNLRNSEKSA